MARGSAGLSDTGHLDKLSGRQKAAVLLVLLGPEIAAKVFRYLSDDDIEDVTMEVANLPSVSPDARAEVLAEFRAMSEAQDHIAEGGLDYAREILERALGPQKAAEIIDRLTASMQSRPFDFVRDADPGQLLNFLHNEHPQTIALILSFCPPDQAASVLSALPPERQVEVAYRLATMERTSPDVLEQVESVLQKKLSTFIASDADSPVGLERAVEVLNRVDRSTEKTILDSLAETDPELAEELKDRMFLFENIVYLDDRSVQRVLREIDTKELALALKTASDEVTEKITKNISKRAREIVEEEIQYMGPVRLKDVEDAQRKIVDVIRRLEEAGEVLIARGGEDEIIV